MYAARSISKPALDAGESRLRFLVIIVGVMALTIIARLFVLQVVSRQFYADLAEGAHELYRQLWPARGKIFFQDSRVGPSAVQAAALDRDLFLIFSDNPQVKDAEDNAEKLAVALNLGSADKFVIFQKMQKPGARYVPLATRLNDETAEKIRTLALPGIGLTRQPFRLYPENNIGSHLLGFYGLDADGKAVGRYGIEGHFDEILAGKKGFVQTEKDPLGGWIPYAKREIVYAEDGADIVLTIDKTLEYVICGALKDAVAEYGAASASVIVMEPKSGAVRVMCGWPDFDPNDYGAVKDITTYNNTTIFTPYEPGSIFKPIGMAAAIDQGIVEPETKFTDDGTRKFGAYTIRNALNKKYGEATMIDVLKESINTGMVFVVFDKLGQDKFKEYVKNFGFGEKSGITLATEASGNISSLEKNGDIYTATASFGQGITATPLQMITAYAAIANGGELVRPRIVEEVRWSNGKVERHEPEIIRRVMAPRTAALVTGMLVTVVNEGHAKATRLKGYTIAGKTGTAQIPGLGGYTTATNQSFIGYAPAQDPKFVMLVKFENPAREFAESTAVPYFAKFAKFILEYYNVPPEN